MTMLILCWVLAMVSALCWARVYTTIFIGATALAFLVTQSALLAAGWLGWVEFAAFAATPWVLATQRARDLLSLKQLHADESTRMAKLSESARSLLSLQSGTQQMEAQITEITDLYHVTKETGGALHLSDLFAASLGIAPRLLDTKGLRLIDLSGETPQVFRAVRAPDGRMVPPLDASPEATYSAEPNISPLGQAAGGGVVPTNGNRHLLPLEQAIVERVKQDPKPSSMSAKALTGETAGDVSHVAWSALSREQQTVGVLVADELPEPQLKTLSIVANQLSLQFSRVYLYRQVESLAVTDSLTGLFVRRHFMERAREELARSKRHGLSCALLMADLDLFKEKNDTYGHLVGDVVLRDVARLLARNLRDIDMIARFGGEEFILLLIETSVEQALPIAQRLKQLVEVHPIRAYDELLNQTISIGIAGFPEHGQTLEAIVERADQALYAAKHAGRNRVVNWTEKLTSA